MDIKIDETYSLKGKGDLKFSIYEKRITKEKIIIEGTQRKKVPLGEGEQGIEQEELISSNLTLEECIRKLISFKIKRNTDVVDLQKFLEIYIEEKKFFEEAVEKIKNIKV